MFTFILGNEIGPRDEVQLLFLSALLMMGAFMNGKILGHITVLLQQLNRRSTKFQEKLDNATTTMKNLSVPVDVQNKVHTYLLYTRSTLDHQKELDTFLTMLSPSLKLEIRRCIFQESVINNKVFGGRVEILDLILQDLTILRFMPEDPICTQGNPGSQVYFIATGTCTVSVIDEHKIEVELAHLTKGKLYLLN